MEIKDFFYFGSKISSSIFQASSIGLEKDENGTDDEDNLIRGTYDDIDFPIIFKQDYGKKLADILGTGWPALYLISDRMKDILEDHQITGWKTFPIKLYDKKKNEILGYHGFSVTGRCGPIDYQKAEIVDRQRVPGGPIYQVYKGLYIGLDKWDMTDFFIPDATLFIITTKKLKSLLTHNKITNLEFKNINDIEVNIGTIKMKMQQETLQKKEEE